MKKYLVIGNPIDHSLSPKLHNYWITINNVKAIYEKKKLVFNEIQDLINDIKAKKISGINVTVPFKKKVINFLDVLSEEAQITQSVNTIYVENNKVVGHNTDIDGFENSIKKINYKLATKKAFILGSGGVVPSIIFALQRMGINEVFVSGRTKSKAENLKSLFKNIKIVDWGELPNFDIIINATSLGLGKHDKIEIDFSNVGKNKLFFDVIYNPKETNFLKQGKELGNLTENGKMMFIFQAQKSFQKWHNIIPKVDIEVERLLDD